MCSVSRAVTTHETCTPIFCPQRFVLTHTSVPYCPPPKQVKASKSCEEIPQPESCSRAKANFPTHGAHAAKHSQRQAGTRAHAHATAKHGEATRAGLHAAAHDVAATHGAPTHATDFKAATAPKISATLKAPATLPLLTSARSSESALARKLGDWGFVLPGETLSERESSLVLHCVVVCGSVLQCVAVCCSVLQCIQSRWRGSRCRCEMLQCVALHCSALYTFSATLSMTSLYLFLKKHHMHTQTQISTRTHTHIRTHTHTHAHKLSHNPCLSLSHTHTHK